MVVEEVDPRRTGPTPQGDVTDAHCLPGIEQAITVELWAMPEKSGEAGPT
jgi:hypothetical protein